MSLEIGVIVKVDWDVGRLEIKPEEIVEQLTILSIKAIKRGR